MGEIVYPKKPVRDGGPYLDTEQEQAKAVQVGIREGSRGYYEGMSTEDVLSIVNNKEAATYYALSKWWAGLASSVNSPAQLAVFSDSTGEGTGTTNVINRWQTLLNNSLRKIRGAQFPFIPAWPGTSAAGMPVVRAGTVGQTSTSTAGGLGWRGIDLRDDTASVTFTFTGDRCKVMYFAASVTGIMTVSIDGGAPVTVNVYTPASPAGHQAWDSGVLTRGAHTVEVRRSPTTTAGQFVYITGLLTYDGDFSSGVRVLDACKHGTKASDITLAKAQGAADALLAAGGAQGIIIGYGINDAAVTSPTVFRDSIQLLIDQVRAKGFSGSILLLGMYMTGLVDASKWSALQKQYIDIAAGDPNISYLSLSNYMPNVPTPYTDPAGEGLYNDSIHPNDAGNLRIAQILSRVLQ